MAKPSQITFKVDPDLEKQLKIEAQRDRRTLSSLVRKLVADGLQKQPTVQRSAA